MTACAHSVTAIAVNSKFVGGHRRRLDSWRGQFFVFPYVSLLITLASVSVLVRTLFFF